ISNMYIRIIQYIYVDFLFFFFFSSRRRHTRSKRDWSSDVCSSDLIESTSERSIGFGISSLGSLPGFFNSSTISFKVKYPTSNSSAFFLISKLSKSSRSEERRVGKECRSRRGLYT